MGVGDDVPVGRHHRAAADEAGAGVDGADLLENEELGRGDLDVLVDHGLGGVARTAVGQDRQDLLVLPDESDKEVAVERPSRERDLRRHVQRDEHRPRLGLVGEPSVGQQLPLDLVGGSRRGGNRQRAQQHHGTQGCQHPCLYACSHNGFSFVLVRPRRCVITEARPSGARSVDGASAGDS